MSYGLALAALLVAWLPAGWAASAELPVTEIDAAVMGEVYKAPLDTARTYVADFTVRADLGGLLLADLEALPVSAGVVLYFAPDGTLLAWSDKSPTVVGATWDIKREGDANEVCAYFGAAPARAVCSSPTRRNGSWIKQSTPGNPFGLVADAPVPFVFHLVEGTGDASGPTLQQLAEQLH